MIVWNATTVGYDPAMPNDDGYFDEHVAATYDDDPDMSAEPWAGRTSCGRGRRPVAVGMGRIAVPAARPAASIEVRVWRCQEDGEAIEVTIGDMATMRAVAMSRSGEAGRLRAWHGRPWQAAVTGRSCASVA